MNNSVTSAQLREHMSACNGTDGWTRVSPFYPKVVVSDGVKWILENVGAFWLMDLVGTEALPKVLAELRKSDDPFSNPLYMTFLRVHVPAGKHGPQEANIWLEQDTGMDPIWRKHISATDFPVGDWTFYIEAMLVGAQPGAEPSLHLGVMVPSER